MGAPTSHISQAAVSNGFCAKLLRNFSHPSIRTNQIVWRQVRMGVKRQPTESWIEGSSSTERRMSSVLSMFTSSKKHPTSKSTLIEASIPESMPIFGCTEASSKPYASQILTSQLQICHLDSTTQQFDAFLPPSSRPVSRAASISVPQIETKPRISPTRPSGKFLSQLPLSLALKTSTVTTCLPVLNACEDNRFSRIRPKLFGSKNRPTTPPVYELAGRSTFVLVHDVILRYRSNFGDDQDWDAVPDNTHFLNASSIICVTDAIQGFKWVLEVKTWTKGYTIRNPIKLAKGAKSPDDKSGNLSRLSWEVVNGLQVWYMVFEQAYLMAEWMTLLRGVVADIKEHKCKWDRSATNSIKSKPSIMSLANSSKEIKSLEIGYLGASVTESLTSSRSSSRLSLCRGTIQGTLSSGTSPLRTSIDEDAMSKLTTMADRLVTTSFEGVPRSSQEDIAVRINSHHNHVTSLVAPHLNISTSSLGSESEHSYLASTLATNRLDHRSSIASVQSHSSSICSERQPTRSALSPTSPSESTNPYIHHALRRTTSGASVKSNASWRHLQSLPPPHPPPTGPLPVPPTQSRPPTKRDLLSLEIGHVFRNDTPKELYKVPPRSSPWSVSRYDDPQIGEYSQR